MKSSTRAMLSSVAEKHRIALIAAAVVCLCAVMLPRVSAAATFDVTNTANSGPGSLRAAIVLANTTPGADQITFGGAALTGCPFTINLTTVLPPFVDPGTSIDGTACGVTIDGSLLTVNDDGLRVFTKDVTIQGLTIRNFPRDAVRIQPTAGGNQPPVTGVVVNNNTLFHNLNGIRVFGGEGPGNVVGTTFTNNTVFQNQDDGIQVNGSFGLDENGGNQVTATIEHNTVFENSGVDTEGTLTGDGIRILGGGGSSGRGVNGGNNVTAYIRENTLRNNVDDGIIVMGAGTAGASNHVVYAEISGNTILNNGAPSATAGNGIIIRAGSVAPVILPLGSNNHVTFLASNNHIAGSKDDGIRIVGGLGSAHSVSGTASKNDISENGGTGINLNGGGGDGNIMNAISLLDNEIDRSGANGILVSGSVGSNNVLSNITLKDNRAKRGGIHGLAVLKVGINNIISFTGITKNRFEKNARDGMFIQLGVPGTNTPISENRTEKNLEDGIDIDDVGYVLSKNRSEDNVGAGISAPGNVNGGGNTATGNGSCNTPGCF